MTERAHAILSPSAADRWATCAASVLLEAGYPDTSSDYADEGTAAHSLAEMALSEGNDAAAYVGRRIGVRPGKTVEITRDMAADVQKYVDYVREVSAGHDLLLEQRLDISAWVPECFGTSDAVILRSDGELHVCDLKFGRGVKVSAEENRQLILYALGALDQFGVLGGFDRVRMTIHQPRLDHVSEWAVPVTDLLARGAEIKTAAARAYLYVDSDTPPAPSDFQVTDKGCRFCKAKGACQAYAEEVGRTVSGGRASRPDAADFEVVMPDAGVPALDLGRLMSRVDLVEAWCKGVRAELERRLLAGEEVEGWKLVAGRAGARKWAGESEAEAALKAMRLKVEQMYDMRLISPTAAEKLVKAGALGPRQWAKLEKIITRSEGSPSVAPASDKRPALVIQPTADDFDDMSQAAQQPATVVEGDDLV